MTYTPTDEQVKRGAAELMRDDPEYENGTYGPEDYEAMARAVLVTVGPSIATDACDLGIRLGWNKALSGYSHEQIRAMNPYREQEAR